ncbi:MAG: hypothetical protein AB7N73_14535 [Gemmatimonadales bacterium]
MSDPGKGYGYADRPDPPSRTVPFGTPDPRVTAPPASEPRRAATATDRALTGFDDIGGQLAATATDTLGRLATLFFAKGLPADPDTLDAILDGLLYRKRFPQLTMAMALVSSDATTVTVLMLPVDPYGGTPGLSWDQPGSVTDNLDNTYTIARPNPGAGMLRVTFTGTLANRLDVVEAIDVPEQAGSGPDLDVVATPGPANYSIAWGGDAVELNIDGGGWGTPPASPITVSRNAAGGAFKEYVFRGTANGQAVTNGVTIPPLDADTVTPDLVVVPQTPSATTQVFNVQATNPKPGGSPPNIVVTIYGSTGSANIAGAISAGVGKAIASGETVTVNRPANGALPATVVFEATIAGGGKEMIHRTVVPQGYGPSLTVSPTEGPTSVSIAWDAVGTVDYRIDGGSWTTPPASPFAVSRNAAGGAAKTVEIRATLDGQATSTPVIVRPQDAGGGSVPPSITHFYLTTTSAALDTATLAFGVDNAPGGYTLDVQWARVRGADGGNEGTVAGISTTSPWTFDIGSLDGNVDVVPKGTGGAEQVTYNMVMLMKSGPTVVASLSTTFSIYGTVTP